MTDTQHERRPWLLLFIAVCLVAMNMRMTITGVGPLLDMIGDDLGIGPSALGALGALPLLTWGLCSPLAHSLSARFGMTNAVTGSLIALALGTVWRSLPGGALNLWFGTAIIGASLAVGNVLLPAIIKREFVNRLSMVMGVYTALLGGMAAVSAGFVVPLAELEVAGNPLGWQLSLAATGLLLIPGVLVWAIARPGARKGEGTFTAQTPTVPDPGAAPRSSVGRALWRDRLAWAVAGYMGMQSAVFYMLQAWLAPIAISFGHSPARAGFEVMLFQIVGIAGSLAFPACFRLLRGRLGLVLPAVAAVCSAGIFLAPAALTLWLAVGGVVSGVTISYALMLMAIRSRTTEAASALSGMAQAIGYTVAALGPFLFGALYEWSGTWLAPLGLLLAASGAQLVLGIAVGRDRFVLDPA